MRNNISSLHKYEKVLLFFLFIFSILINQYYGNLGVSPLDSFSHFDTSFRVLNGEFPFRDFWAISGPIVDYIQAIFFFIFGINWQAYVLHASFINGILTLTSYLVFRNFNLSVGYSFFYSFLFSILAYPTSGTPFVDHHAAFFSLLGVYFSILAIKKENKFFWYMLPIFFGFAFLSKIVPSSYIILCLTIILLSYSYINKKFHLLKYSIFSSIIFILLLIFIFKLQGVKISSVLIQYILHPLSVGSERVDFYSLTFKGLIFHFKFIYFALVPFFFVTIKRIIKNKNYLKHKDFYYILIILSLVFTLIVHQILTQNQTFIFFLIPILTAFSHVSLEKLKLKKNYLKILLILLCIYSTTKYHFRFNENRKFHDLNHLDFNLVLDGSLIDNKFNGLKWISPEFPNNPKKEIRLLLKIKNLLNADKRKKVLITNYSFFSGILDLKLNSPVRWHLTSGQTSPKLGSKYFKNYRNFYLEKLKENEIEVIYIIKPFDTNVLTGIIDEKCLQTSEIDENINIHLIQKCNNLR
jgi:hypothetical protein|tara:strand:+ start:1014 stop:2585 length:1572 start_codon:yes stop_codon:yes gene_type:complete